MPRLTPNELAQCIGSDSVLQTAEGSIEAQNVLDGMRNDTLSGEHAWLGFVQVAVRHGWKSAACRAYVLELAKRAAA